jgi:hypothetical protein
VIERRGEQSAPTGYVVERYRNRVLHERGNASGGTRFDECADGRQLIRLERHRHLFRRHTGYHTTTTSIGGPAVVVILPCDFAEDRLLRLVREGVDGGASSLSRAAEILDIDLRSMRQLAGSWAE